MGTRVFTSSLALVAFGFGAPLAAQHGFESGYATEKEAEQRDMEALQEYIKTKRAITVQEKGGNMMISGDVRGEWYCMHAKTDHKYQRGGRRATCFQIQLPTKRPPPSLTGSTRNIRFLRSSRIARAEIKSFLRTQRMSLM